MIRFAPYLNFRGNAREAMEFYRSVFGGELVLNTGEQLGLTLDDHRRHQIMHAQLTTPAGLVLLGSDIHADDAGAIVAGNLTTIMVSGTEADVRKAWDQLTVDGRIDIPFGVAPWGDLFGSCVDQFGVPWLVNVN